MPLATYPPLSHCTLSNYFPNVAGNPGPDGLIIRANVVVSHS